MVLKITDKASSFAQKFVRKGKRTKELFDVKAEIGTCENVITRSYTAIGRKYYSMFADGGYDPEFDKQMKDIANAMKAIKELENKLEDIRSETM